MLGVMSLLEIKIALVTSNMPVLLFVLMLPYNVYFIERYRERRSEVEALINDQAELSKLTRRRSRDYLKSFYRIIDDPKLARKYLFKRCI